MSKREKRGRAALPTLRAGDLPEIAAALDSLEQRLVGVRLTGDTETERSLRAVRKAVLIANKAMHSEFGMREPIGIGERLSALFAPKITGWQAFMERRIDAEAAVSKNPVYAWHAWKVWRAANKTPPAWVLDYFDRITEEILELAQRSEKETLKSVGGLLLSILGFGSRGGGPTAFTSYTLFQRDVRLSVEVSEEIRGGKRSGQAIASVASSRGLDPKTVDRAWRAHRDWLALPLRRVRAMVEGTVKDKNP